MYIAPKFTTAQAATSKKALNEEEIPSLSRSSTIIGYHPHLARDEQVVGHHRHHRQQHRFLLGKPDGVLE